MADAQAGNGAEVIDTQDVVLVDDVWDWTAPPVEHKRTQVKRPPEESQVLIEEHFPESPGFLEQLELLQIEGFPGPLETVQGMASGPALPAFLAKANQEL